MISEVLNEDYISLEEMAKVLRIKVSTLKNRISTGTEHPPYQKIGREIVFIKDEFRKWVRSRPVIYEVKSAS